MTFRTDTLVKRTLKPHRCDWCGERIDAGQQMVRVSGRHEDFWTAKLHPECWRAEHIYSISGMDIDGGWLPGDQARGRTDDDSEAGPEFTSRSITEAELKDPRNFNYTWKLNTAVA